MRKLERWEDAVTDLLFAAKTLKHDGLLLALSDCYAKLDDTERASAYRKQATAQQ